MKRWLLFWMVILLGFSFLIVGDLRPQTSSPSESPEQDVQPLPAVSITSLAFSPDNRYALSGNSDSTIRLWEVDERKQIGVFIGHTKPVCSVAFSPNGKRILSGSWDNTLRLWETETGKQLLIFTGHTEPVRAVAFSPDGRYVLSAGGSFEKDRALRLWALDTGEQVRDFAGHTLDVTSLSFSPDGRYIASGGRDNTLRLWEVETGRPVHNLGEHEFDITSVAFSPDGRYVLSGSEDGALRLWEVETGEEARVFTGHVAPVRSAVFSSDGQHVLSAHDDGGVLTWEAETGAKIREFKAEPAKLVAFSTDGQQVLLVDNYGTLQLWDVQKAEALANLQTEEAFNPSLETTIDPGTPKQVTGTEITILYSGEDTQNPSGALQYSWRIDSAEWTAFSEETKAELRDLKVGSHVFEVIARDASGRIQMTPARYFFTVGKQEPELRILDPPENVMESSDYKFHLSGSDLQTPAEELQYSWRLDGGEWSEFSSESSAQLSQLQPGIHLFEARVKDADGYIASAASAFASVESLPETRILKRPKDKKVVGSSYTFEFLGSDSQTPDGQLQYSWRLDGGEWSQFSRSTSAPLSDLSEGTHLFQVRTRGADGRIDPTPDEAIFTVVAPERPETRIITQVDGALGLSSYTFEFGSEGGLPPVRYSWKLDNEDWREYSPESKVLVENLTNGHHFLEVRATDSQGYEDPTPARLSFEVNIEEQRPEIRDWDPDLGVLKRRRLLVNGWDPQTPSELEYSHKLDGENWSAYSKEPSVSLDVLEPREYVLYVRVRDPDGNESEIYQTRFLIKRPFYRNRAFFGGIAAIFLAVLCVLVAMQLRIYQKRRYALKTQYNPYTPGGPVMEESKFIGRREFLNELRASIHNTNFIIMGDNRIGKTSVLYRLAAELKTMEANSYLYLPFYIDISDATDTDGLFERLLMETKNQVIESLPEIAIDSTHEKRANSFYRFQALIGAILRELEERETGGRLIRLVFLLDECDALNNLEESAKARIRTIFTQRYAQNVSAVLTGVYIDLESTARKSPWWNTFMIKLMTPFTDEEVKALIKEPVGNIYRFEDEAIDAIMDWSERNPYLVQLLCHRGVNMAINERRYRITADDIQKIISSSEGEKSAIRKAPTPAELKSQRVDLSIAE
jgi:hypothetical protein